ncbi:uncharacterized protein LOC120571998 [Perca fluviatilis]|uniref:uncharacterized protein LOC120571998 n=1 Tax=Perca fluviatilis TaxID=8168 RepID=UPI0019666DBA|nr:uncharacterized protein LOC120571998 [Perca fluviatilis]XP_039677114.1 uncharacterized protein LOC120571998 [Perca fluviatilis]
MWLDPRIVKKSELQQHFTVLQSEATATAYKSLDLNENHMDRGSGTEASEAVLTLHDSLLRFSMLLFRLTHTKSNAALRECSAPRRVQVNTAAATESNHSRCRARFFSRIFYKYCMLSRPELSLTGEEGDVDDDTELPPPPSPQDCSSPVPSASVSSRQARRGKLFCAMY